MNQYKISIYLEKQIGFLFGVDENFVKVNLPFLTIMFGRDSEAYGYLIFGKEIY